MVNRCICSDIRFDEVLKICRKLGLHTSEQLRERNICCCNCTLCLPYVEEMLQTGQTSFVPGAVAQTEKKNK